MKGICYHCEEVIDYEMLPNKNNYLIPLGKCQNKNCSEYNQEQQLLYTQEEINDRLTLLKNLLELKLAANTDYINCEKYTKDMIEINHLEELKEKISNSLMEIK